MAYGEIILGYRGIGKTTLATEPMSIRSVDLDSYPFKKYGMVENWDKIYCDIAINLSNLGFAVFVDTDKEIEDRLREIAIEEYNKWKEDDKNKRRQFVVICPSLNLKDKWIEKMENAGDEERYLYVKENYEKDIERLTQSGFFIHTINEIDYQLDEEVVGSRISFMKKQREEWNYNFIKE